MTTRSRRYLLLATLVCLGSGMLSACYTLFQHPQLASMNYRRPRDKTCLKCHSRTELWTYLHPPGNNEKRDPWSDFYDTPWWFDRYARADSAHARVDSTASGGQR